MALKANAWACVASQRIGVKRPRRDETITWKPATGVGIAAAIRGDPKRQKQKPLHEGDGAGCKPPAGLQRGEGKSFFLDILFYRMSDNALSSRAPGPRNLMKVVPVTVLFSAPGSRLSTLFSSTDRQVPCYALRVTRAHFEAPMLGA